MAHIDQPQRLSACRLSGASPAIAEAPAKSTRMTQNAPGQIVLTTAAS
jgi:hypothetical protein